MRMVVACLVTLCASGGVQVLRAQAPLPVQGTAALTLNWHDVGLEGFGTSAGYGRWFGRVAVRVLPRLYVGVGGGSWEMPIAVGSMQQGAIVAAEDSLSTLSSAIVYSAYGQYYPLGSLALFLRAGAGLARTSTYYPLDGIILQQSSGRFALSAGAGVDLGIASHLYLTPAVDYTALLGVPAGVELRDSFSASLGLTIR